MFGCHDSIIREDLDGVRRSRTADQVDLSAGHKSGHGVPCTAYKPEGKQKAAQGMIRMGNSLEDSCRRAEQVLFVGVRI